MCVGVAAGVMHTTNDDDTNICHRGNGNEGSVYHQVALGGIVHCMKGDDETVIYSFILS